MNCRWIAVLGVVVALPWALIAQVDPSQGQTGALQPNSSQTTSGTMRETLGAPGVSGQQLADRAFIRAAIEGGLAQIRLGELAVQKGSADLKPVAQKLVDDHLAINKDLSAVGDSLGVLPPKKLSKEDQAEFDKLSGLAGKAFDAEYVPFIFKAHMKDMHDFYREASAAADPELATTAANAMKTMHDHIEALIKVAAAEDIKLPPRPARPAHSQSDADQHDHDGGAPPMIPKPMPPEK